MKVVGIIAEYNPFHKGHMYHIEESKRLSGADFCIVVMSGSFVQRGGPAICDKHERAQAALMNGADLVLELPPAYALGSAEIFARGGVEILHRLGIVDFLSFGCECGDLSILTAAAGRLFEESPDFKMKLKEALARGNNFAKARAIAFGDEKGDLLSSPNDILAIEYLLALMRLQSPIQALAIPRIGASYHESDLRSETGNKFPSATAIRKCLFGLCVNGDATVNQPFDAPIDIHCSKSADTPYDGSRNKSTAINLPVNDSVPVHLPANVPADMHCDKCTDMIRNNSLSMLSLKETMPLEMYECLTNGFKYHTLLEENDFSLLLHEKILVQSEEELSTHPSISPDLARRIKNNQYACRSFTEFADLIKTKNYTHSRIRRAFMEIILDIHKENPIDMVRVLGCRKEALPLLSAIDRKGSVRLITSLAKEEPFWAADLIYDMVKMHKGGLSSMTAEPSKGLLII